MTVDGKFFTDGAAYERMMGRWSRAVGARFLEWLALPHGLDWLDVGCGNGAFTALLMTSSHPRSIAGVDPSEAQIAFARNRADIGAASLQVGTAEALPYATATCDVAVMALVIGFVDDPALAVREMARVTRPGGTVASYVWDRRGGQPAAPFRRAAVDLGLLAPAPRPALDVTQIETLAALWQAAGLADIQTRIIEIEVSYDDLDDYWRSSTLLANPSVQFLKDLSPADTRRVRRRLDETLPRDGSGRIVFAARTHAVRGLVP